MDKTLISCFSCTGGQIHLSRSFSLNVLPQRTPHHHPLYIDIIPFPAQSSFLFFTSFLSTPIAFWSNFSSVQFSHSVVSDSLRPHELQLARPPCPSLTPGVYPNSCPLSWWCHPTISFSVIPFSSCLQSFPTSGSFQMSQLFMSGGQNIGGIIYIIKCTHFKCTGWWVLINVATITKIKNFFIILKIPLYPFPSIPTPGPRHSLIWFPSLWVIFDFSRLSYI